MFLFQSPLIGEWTLHKCMFMTVPPLPLQLRPLRRPEWVTEHTHVRPVQVWTNVPPWETAQRGAGCAGVNHSESPWERRAEGAMSCSQVQDMLCAHGSLVPKSQLPRCFSAGLRPPSVCVFSLFPLGNKTLANLGCVCLCVGESGFPVTLEPDGQFLPDLTKGQRTQGELNSHSAIQNTVCNCMLSQSLCLTPQQCVWFTQSQSKAH